MIVPRGGKQFSPSKNNLCGILGAKIGSPEAARRMLARKLQIDTIMEITELSRNQIEEIEEIGA
jgi:hypothetical protein